MPFPVRGIPVKASLTGMPYEIRNTIIQHALGGVVYPYGKSDGLASSASSWGTGCRGTRLRDRGADLRGVLGSNSVALNLQLVCKQMKDETREALRIGCVWLFPRLNALEQFLVSAHYTSVWRQTLQHMCLWVATADAKKLWASGRAVASLDDYRCAANALCLDARVALNRTALWSCEIIVRCHVSEHGPDIFTPPPTDGRARFIAPGTSEWAMIVDAVAEGIALPVRLRAHGNAEVHVSVPGMFASTADDGMALKDTIDAQGVFPQSSSRWLGTAGKSLTITRSKDIKAHGSFDEWAAESSRGGRWGELAAWQVRNDSVKSELDEMLGEDWFELCREPCLCCAHICQQEKERDDCIWCDDY